MRSILSYALAAALVALAPVAALAQTSASSMSSAMTSIKVPLHAQNGSGQNGTATLTQKGPDIVVTVSITNGSALPQPDHIHPGTCAKLNPVPKYPLANVVDGKSTTVLKNMQLASLETGGYAINVHKSVAQIAIYTSCGNIPKMAM
jgi:hypothetical protein